jgi:hypothetical protein
MNTVTVYKNRTTIIGVELGYDVSGDTITSEIREEKDSTSTLFASWDVSFTTDGEDGSLIFTIDNSDLPETFPEDGTAFMDIKRTSAGEPLPVHKKPIRVKFVEVVTA